MSRCQPVLQGCGEPHQFIPLLEDEGEPALFVVRAGKAMRVPVKLGYLDGQWAEIRDGVKVGDQVVIAGMVALRDGSAVQVIGQPTAKAVANAKPAADSKKQ